MRSKIETNVGQLTIIHAANIVTVFVICAATLQPQPRPDAGIFHFVTMASMKPFMWVLAALALFAIVLTFSQPAAAAGRDLLETTDAVSQADGVDAKDFHHGHHGHQGHGKKGSHKEVEKLAETEGYHHKHHHHEGKHHGKKP